MTAEPAPQPEPDPRAENRSRDWLHRLRDVRESGDRRAAAPLVQALIQDLLDDNQHSDVVDTLCVLEDLRCENALTDILVSGTASLRVREAALRVLACLPSDDPPPLRVAAWLDDPDPLVRAHGATFLIPRDEERLARLMRDPAPVVRRAAAEALVASARTPSLVETLRRALRDADPYVREVACRAALFDEPLAATYDLLHLLDDPDPDVRCGVYDALEDFPCVSVLLALADARSGPEGELAAVSLALLVTRVTVVLATSGERGAERILRWIAPARWVLDEDWNSGTWDGDGDGDGELRGEDGGDAPVSASGDGGEVEGGGSGGDPAVANAVADDAEQASDGDGDGGRSRPAVDCARARRILADPDAAAVEQRALLVDRDWGGTGADGLRLLRDLARAPGWDVRHGVAIALFDLLRAAGTGGGARVGEGGSGELGAVGRGAADALLCSARDVEPIVRRIGLHALTHARDPRVVEAARETLADEGARHLAGDAALQAIVALGDRAQAEAAIRAELQVEVDRDGLQLGAIHLAERLASEVPWPAVAADLRRIVESPIVGGVAVHVAALQVLRTLTAASAGTRMSPASVPLTPVCLERPVSLAHLEAVDHLDIQAQLGLFGWRGGRFG